MAVPAEYSRARRIIEGIAFGAVFGMAFPLVATLIVLLSADQALTFAHAWRHHMDEPLLQMIDAFPLLLGAAFGLVGRAVSRLDNSIEGLQGRVVQRNAVIKRSQVEADAARWAKSALLGQVAGEVQSLVDKSKVALERLAQSTLDSEQHGLVQSVAWTQEKVLDGI
jgi:hypothetical protein